jgi:hypothetical protein
MQTHSFDRDRLREGGMGVVDVVVGFNGAEILEWYGARSVVGM